MGRNKRPVSVWTVQRSVMASTFRLTPGEWVGPRDLYPGPRAHHEDWVSPSPLITRPCGSVRIIVVDEAIMHGAYAVRSLFCVGNRSLAGRAPPDTSTARFSPVKRTVAGENQMPRCCARRGIQSRCRNEGSAGANGPGTRR